jgi:hypothetical protein
MEVNPYSDLKLCETLVNKFIDLGIDGRIDLLLMFYADNKYRNKITEEQKEILDYIFSDYYPRLIEEPGQENIEDIEQRRYCREDDFKSETLQIMVEEKLVIDFIEMGFRNYSPTALGHRINERGGWLKHIEREEANRALTASLSNSVIKTNWFQRINVVVTIIIIVYGLYISIQNYHLTQKTQELEEKQLPLLQSQSKLQEQVVSYQYLFDSISLHLLRTQNSSPKDVGIK